MASRAHLIVKLDREAASSLTHQVFDNIRTAIDDGRLEVGARLPSVRDLAIQLGVARGTVQAAYDALVSELLLSTAGSAGTRVIAKPPVHASAPSEPIVRPLATMLRGFSLTALPFQTGVPAQDAFPTKLWTSLLGRAVRDDAMTPTTYPDPRGHPELRAQIAAYLAIARGIRCVPDQVIVTVCYRAGLALALQVLGASGQRASVYVGPFAEIGAKDPAVDFQFFLHAMNGVLSAQRSFPRKNFESRILRPSIEGLLRALPGKSQGQLRH